MTIQEMQEIPTYTYANGYKIIYQSDYDEYVEQLHKTVEAEKVEEYSKGFAEGSKSTKVPELQAQLDEVKDKYIKLLEYTS